MNEIDIHDHKVNPNCGCTKCFVKDIMDKSDCSYKEAIDELMELQDRGILKINSYDNEGFPMEIERVVSKKDLKKILAEDNL